MKGQELNLGDGGYKGSDYVLEVFLCMFGNLPAKM